MADCKQKLEELILFAAVFSSIFLFSDIANAAFIQDNAAGGDCDSIGIWDQNTKTCVLTTDVNNFIAIESDNITLDGAGHQLAGNNDGFGIFVNQRQNIAVKNLKIKNFAYGIYVSNSENNLITGNIVSGNSEAGIVLFNSYANSVTENDVSNNQTGLEILYIYPMSENKVYRNNFVNNSNQVFAMSDVGDSFFQNPPIGGNYWSNYDEPTEGCSDQNSDNFCDSSYVFWEGQDDFSWIKQSGWITNQSPIISNFNQYKSDSTTQIQENGITQESTVVFKATIQDQDSDQVKLQVEIKEKDQVFNEQDIIESGFVNSGGEAAVTRYGLVPGSYKWRARAADSRGAVSEWQEFGTAGDVDFVVDLPLSYKAANLAKLVINAPYLGDGDTYGGKGWDLVGEIYVSPDKIFTGYNYWNNKLIEKAFGAGLDCSGLTQWAYNYSFDPQKSLLQNAIRYDGADGQYRNNTETIVENDLQSGDLLFLDKGNNNFIDHVAIYVGNNGDYDIVEAFSQQKGIIASDKNEFKTRIGFDQNKHIRRVVLSPFLGGQVKAGSQIDLIVIDPDSFTIMPTTAIQTDNEYLREIPGELYYSESELGIDGRPEDIVYWPKQKTGDYIIKALPEAGVALTETYSLEFMADEQTIILADNIPLNQIPFEGYGINIASDGAVNIFVPVVVDIKPGSYPNSVNLGSNGVVPVAIFGSNTFDVYQIYLESITLANASIKLKSNGKLMAGYSDINGDGFTDVVVHIAAEALQLTSSDVKAELNGSLLGGREIKGSDSVRIVP